MNIHEFLNDEIVILPKKSCDGHLPSYINRLFKLFLQKIDLLDSDSPISRRIKRERNSIERLCNSIKRAIDKYYQGYPSEAYNEFVTGLRGIKGYLVYNNVRSEEIKNLFRMRIGNNHTYQKEEMFHIPFELRNRVKTQRYSIPGLPCLYLGGSVYICWEEMGKPDVNSIQVTRFEAVENSNLKVLDLGFRSSYMSMKLSWYDRGVIFDEGEEPRTNPLWLEENIAAFIISWPLIAACSIKVIDRDANFKSEYIIPQLTLQWIRLNKDFDGIRYFSVNPEFYTRSYDLYYNYVFPVKSSLKSGLCRDLLGKFKVTETVSWQVAKLCPLDLIHFRDVIPYERGTNALKTIQLINGIPAEYRKTDFGIIENSLRQMEVTTIE